MKDCSSKILIYAREKMNSCSSEVAGFHRQFVNDFINNYFEKTLTEDEDSYQAFLLKLNDSICNYEFEKVKIDGDPLKRFPFLLDFNWFRCYLITFFKLDLDCSLKSVNASANSKVPYKVDIDNLCSDLNKIETFFDAYIQKSSSYDNFKELTGDLFVDIVTTKNYLEYLLLKLYYDIFVDSVDIWSNYIIKGKKSATWDAVKSGWDDIKPYVAADAGGAVAGGLYGIEGGLVGVLIGALVGAAVTSIAKGAETAVLNVK